MPRAPIQLLAARDGEVLLHLFFVGVGERFHQLLDARRVRRLQVQGRADGRAGARAVAPPPLALAPTAAAAAAFAAAAPALPAALAFAALAAASAALAAPRGRGRDLLRSGRRGGRGGRSRAAVSAAPARTWESSARRAGWARRRRWARSSSAARSRLV